MKVRLVAKGIVQGVGYRNFVKEAAIKNFIKGSVSNLHNGTVEIFAEGEEKRMEEFITEIRFAEGSMATVEELKIYKEGEKGFNWPFINKNNFTII
ncbi:MAG: acylphosphatase [Candidatus Micrarchaeia archaeon]